MKSLLAKLRRESPTSSRKVIVGLGNPGLQYRETRHNVGFLVVDRLIDRHAVSRSRTKFKAEVFEAQTEPGEQLLLVKPQTYMNLSGQTVASLVGYYDLPLEDLIVVCDDFNLPLGRLRFRRNGSHGGQKGLADIIQRLGTNEFSRLRLGIAAPGTDPIDHVLGRFTPDERPIVADSVARSAEALELWIRQGIEPVMNQYNAAPS